MRSRSVPPLPICLRALLVWSAALVAVPGAGAAPPSLDDAARWARHADDVTIVRDDWGIAHVHGRTDADAVFGAIYAQAEDDFPRIEANYLTALGRTAEADGEASLWQDLRMRLFVDSADLRRQFAASPPWLQRLMTAWADGLNFYLQAHPAVQPRVIRHFEPWMALSFSEGSIGGDVERVSLEALRAFYSAPASLPPIADSGHSRDTEPRGSNGIAIAPSEPRGSNGIAIAPSNTVAGHALLLINPHTSFFFRSELQMTSDDGLNAYGASTWGQFFIYQGFNAHAGWMHTSSGIDNVDEFAERIVHRRGRLWSVHGSGLRPVTSHSIRIAFKAADGRLAHRRYTVWRTHHGPVVRQAEDGRWIAIALMNTPVQALEQSFLRTKAVDYAGFVEVAGLRANSSNNTIFADDKGEIAYLHPQFVPLRDDRIDFHGTVDGSDPAADWKGLHNLDTLPRVKDPASGWVMNTNDWPWSAAGPNDSPRRDDYPRYMDVFGENPRGVHATAVLRGRRDFTLDGLLAAAYDPFMPAFAKLIPSLVAAYDRAGDGADAALHDQVALLRQWDDRWSLDSTATSLAIFWSEALQPALGVRAPDSGNQITDDLLARTTDRQKLAALAAASDRLQRDFGDWRVRWGEINRFQRLTGELVQPFDDARPSTPVPFPSSQWGSLAAFGARRYDGTKRYYGTSGNSFVAAVEFGETVRAKAVSAGGESGDPASPHFGDQVDRYASGTLRDVYFYPEQLVGHTERSYHPGR